MELTTDIKIGQVVKSKAGRDKGRVFIVTDVIDECHVMICDGDLRKLNQPKLKKIKHLIINNTVLSEFAEMLKSNKNLNDAYVRKLLMPFNDDASERMEVE